MAKTSIEEKYKVLNEVEHVLHRPGMYVGSTKAHTSSEYLYRDGRFERVECTFNPGFLKLFDEIISNAVDESKRNKGLNRITVDVDQKKSMISVQDNGGIPVVQHKEQKKLVPEVIFSNLRAGSNFDDNEQRTVAGTNGVGATLTNIFSLEFRIETCDGKKKFVQVFKNNMSTRSNPKLSDSTKGYTKISYIPELSRFGMKSIDDIHIELIRKRVIDLAACNPGLDIRFNGEKYKFKSLKEYSLLYVDDVFYESSDDWEICIGHSNSGYQTVSFANSVETKDGGTHVNYISGQIDGQLREMIRKKHKIDVKPSEIKNHLFLFVNCSVHNPAFSSQTKEKLITEPREFGTSHEISDKTINKIFKSEVIQSLLDWYDKKKEAEERAKLRKLNKNLDKTKVAKLIDAKKRENREHCVLGIFEGQSAQSAVRKFRDAQLFGAFPLKGKFSNVTERKKSDIIKNQEAVELMASIGLRLGEEPGPDLRYGKIYIYTDADPDGDCISALLINFFDCFWPELFDQGRIYRVLTPLVVAKRGKSVEYFYNANDFEKWRDTHSGNWEIEYKKGLAALEDPEYLEIIKNPKLVQIKNDNKYKESLNAWFGGDSQPRKERLMKS